MEIIRYHDFNGFMALPYGLPSTPNTISNWRPSLDFGKTMVGTTDAYIGCWFGHMIISNGKNTKNLVLYPPAEPNLSAESIGRKKSLYRKESQSKNEELRPVLTIGQAL